MPLLLGDLFQQVRYIARHFPDVADIHLDADDTGKDRQCQSQPKYSHNLSPSMK